MSKRNTETLFLRVDPEVARLVRRESDQRQVGISQLAELALRAYLAQTTEAEDRQNFLTGVEEGLVRRLEGRLAGMLERVASLYAKEAFDHAEGLFLVKALASMMVKDERILEKILVGARKDATERLKSRAGSEVEILAQGRAEVERLRAELAQTRKEIAAQQARAEKAEQQAAEAVKKEAALQAALHKAKQVHEYQEARDEWAAHQYEHQGMLRRKSFQEWRAEYERQYPAPAREVG